MRGALAVAFGLILVSPAVEAAVAGRVLGPDGQPVAGATVTAYSPESSDQRALRLMRGTPRAPLGRLLTTAVGAFRFDVLAAPLELEVRARGFAPASAEGSSEAPIALKRAVLRRGTVTAQGRPVAGARVVWTGAGEWLAETAADGSYEVPDPEGWAYQVLILHPDHAPLEDAAQGWEGGFEHTLDVGVAIAGRVLDERQRAVPDATIWVAQETSWPLATSGPDGSFRIAHAPRDWSTLRARTASLVGSAARRAGALTVVVSPARSLAGTVRDGKTGRPLAGATLWVASRSEGFATGRTDSQGRYVIDGLGPGLYRAAAASDGYASAEVGAEGGLPVDLRSVSAVRRDFTLDPLPTVTGRVEDEKHLPVEGALVTLGFEKAPHIYAPHPFAMMKMPESATRTASDGSFTLALPAAEPSNGSLANRPLVVLKTGYAAARVEMKPQPPSVPRPLVVTLSRGTTLKGRTVARGGAPLAGVAVTLAEDGSFGMVPTHVMLTGLGAEGWVTTAADGTFEVHVHPAAHHLSFHRSGLAPKAVRGYDPRSGETLEVVLDPAASVSGRVTRANGQGVSKVTVALSQSEKMSLTSQSAITSADGAFEIDDLGPGHYELRAWSRELGINETRQVAAPSSDVLIQLGPVGTVRGRVVDAASRKPLPAFTLGFQWREESEEAGARQLEVQDAGGAFSVAELPVGRVSLVVAAAGHASRRIEDVAVALDAEAPELEVSLEAEGPVRGRVTSDGQAGISEATIEVTLRDGEESSSAMTDDQGNYEVSGMAPGELTLVFEAQGFLREKRTVDTRQTSRVDVTLSRGLGLGGEVLGEAGPVEGAMVSASSGAASASYQVAHTNERGRFRLEGLVAGRYTVTAQTADGGTAKVEDVDPQTSGPLRLLLAKPKTAVLTGKVMGLGPADENIPVIVHASPQGDGASAQAMVDSAQAFRMTDAPAGPVQVYAQIAALGGAMRTSRIQDLVLAPGSETDTVIEFGSDSISGQVTREGGPLAGVTVAFSGGRTGVATSRTDARGAYQVFGLDPGNYTVQVSGDGTSYGTEYTVTGPGEFDIDVTGASVEGRVVRADGGAPVRGVEVSFWLMGGKENSPTQSATSNERGEFSLRSVREGRYRLTTSKAGFGQQVREVEMARGASTPVMIELAAADGINVTVVDQRDGRPLEATVVVRDAAKHIVANRHSGVGADGALNIPLADGAYLLSTSASGYGTATLPVTAPSSGLRVGLTPGGTLVIESARIVQGRVRLIQPDGEEYVRCWCNGIAEIELRGRRTTVENVASGSYTLEVLVQSEVVARQAVVIREGQRSVVTVE